MSVLTPHPIGVPACVMGARFQDEPAAGRRPKNRHVGLAVPVIVSWLGCVPRGSPLIPLPGREVGARWQDEPLAGGGPIDGDVGPAIPVIVRRDGEVPDGAP